jgi:choline dehydrogenase-like flavoprotein
VFIEILDRAVTHRGVHLQVYTYNDYYLRMARDRLGPLFSLAAPLAEPLINRLVVIKGYLHSAESAGIRATIERRSGGTALRLDAVDSARSTAVIRAVTTLLSRNARRIGASPLRLGLRTGRPGSGVHVGGSFPMRTHPTTFDTDVMGRPPDFTRVHVVDATVFPTVAAAPPTLTIMANAYRIASGSPQE